MVDFGDRNNVGSGTRRDPCAVGVLLSGWLRPTSSHRIDYATGVVGTVGSPARHAIERCDP